MRKIQLLFLFSVLLVAVLAAPFPEQETQPGPLAVIGNLIQRLQNSFEEGSNSIKAPTGISFPILGNPVETTTTTTTTTTTPPPTTSRPTYKPITNAFDSINAILDNLSRSTGNAANSLQLNNQKNNFNNNIFGSVPGRSLDLPFTTPRPFLPPTTSRSPFEIDGVNQGINAFLQAFIKTNLNRIFRPAASDQQHSIAPRSDPPQQPSRPPSLGEIIFNGLFGKQQV